MILLNLQFTEKWTKQIHEINSIVKKILPESAPKYAGLYKYCHIEGHSNKYYLCTKQEKCWKEPYNEGRLLNEGRSDEGLLMKAI